jgi:dihydroflavonol-4-reductase
MKQTISDLSERKGETGAKQKNKKAMKVGITGVTGHVGFNVLRALYPEGHRIKVLVRNKTGLFKDYDIELVKGDITRKETLTAFCKDLDAVIHLAALISIGNDNYGKVYDANVTGTENLVEACKDAGVKRFVHFSSIHALEHKPYDEPMDETRPLTQNKKIAYEYTKALAEQYVLKQNRPGFTTVVLNPTAIVGPYDYKPSFVGRFLIMVYKGVLPGLVPGGYNWVDVRDVAGAAVTALSKGKGGERYILSGQWQPLKTVAGIVCEAKGVKNKIPVLPLWLAKTGVPFLSAFSKITGKSPLYTNESLYILQSGNRKIINAKARKQLDFSPRPLHESVTGAISWFKKMSYI